MKFRASQNCLSQLEQPFAHMPNILFIYFQVKYTGYRDRPLEERQVRFQNGCREGHTEIAFAATGTNLQLVFGVASGNFAGDPRECDFDKEHGKVFKK